MPTASLAVLAVVDQTQAPHAEGVVEYPLEVLISVSAREGPALAALAAGGWEYVDAFAQDGGLVDDDGNTILETVVSFRKDFPDHDGAAVAADVRRYIDSYEFEPAFSWEDGWEDEENLRYQWSVEEFEP